MIATPGLELRVGTCADVNAVQFVRHAAFLDNQLILKYFSGDRTARAFQEGRVGLLYPQQGPNDGPRNEPASEITAPQGMILSEYV